jgi:hypothetical protein
MTFSALRDDFERVQAFMCDGCKELFHFPCPSRCVHCDLEREEKEREAKWIMRTVGCPECNGVKCEECNNLGRVTPEIATFLKQTVVCDKCGGEGCFFCKWGRIPKT